MFDTYKALGSALSTTKEKKKTQRNRLTAVDLNWLWGYSSVVCSLCSCTGGVFFRVPLEKDNSEEFRQRELRAAQLAREIESSPQYRLRIAMENDDGRTEEEKHSAVQRQGSGRESPSLVSR